VSFAAVIDVSPDGRPSSDRRTHSNPQTSTDPPDSNTPATLPVGCKQFAESRCFRINYFGRTFLTPASANSVLRVGSAAHAGGLSTPNLRSQVMNETNLLVQTSSDAAQHDQTPPKIVRFQTIDPELLQRCGGRSANKAGSREASRSMNS
jgi:hypothetical protein